jgi:hypothetical protein
MQLPLGRRKLTVFARRKCSQNLRDDEARYVPRCDAGEGVAQRPREVTAGLAKDVDAVNQ